MSKKLLVAALALACVTSLGFAGQDSRPQRPDGPPRGQREMRDQRDNRGPRKGFEGRGHHGDWMRGDRGHGRGWDNDRGPGGPRHMGMMGKHFGPGMGGRGHGMWILRDIELNADQKAKFVDIMTDNYRKTLELRLAVQDAQRKAFDIRKSDGASSDEVIAMHRQIGELRGKFEAAERELRDQLKAILTPEQAAKLDEARKDPPSPRFGDRRHGGGPRRGWYDDNDVDTDDIIDDMDDGE